MGCFHILSERHYHVLGRLAVKCGHGGDIP